ncbi:hypothetical protein, partial [Algibacter sp.]|uniref:hypothetical protein n=1 Tax=Algibacter sp. TaxID=1872428 RepID=UPI003C76D18D
ILTVLFSCGSDKVILLPEIGHSEITEILDVSPAYLFYDETQVDSVELNRKNLISTTNWLINVDKRLTLKRVIPHIKYLQDKKANSSHKKEGTRNYFTCNDTSIKNLGFIDFTDVRYQNESLDNYSDALSSIDSLSNSTAIAFEKNNTIVIASTSLKTRFLETSKDSISFYMKKCDTLNGIILLNFNENLSFQNYIDYKSIIENTDLKQTEISNNEFIFN